MKIFNIALVLPALLFCLAPVASANESETTVSVEVSYDNGTLQHNGGSGSWKYLWTSTRTDPQVTVNTTVNNIKNGTTGPLIIAPGTQAPHTIVIATAGEGWQITGYSFTVSGTAGKQIEHNGTVTQITDTPQQVAETGLSGTSHTLSYTGENTEARFENFTVTLAPYEGVDEPELTVDEMPAPDAGCVFTVTNMVNGDYNDFTAWYHMQLGREFLSGASMTDVGRNGSFDDAMLYCFIKENDGYAIYNKAEGKTELTYVDGKVMNGADELTVTLARRFLPVNTSTGKVYRDENDFASTNKWRKCWKSDYEPQVVLTGSSNNMTTTGSTSSFSNTGNIVLETGSSAGGDYKWMFRADNNMFVSNYTFLAKKEAEFAESASITAGGEVVNLTTKLKRIEASLTDDLAECSFVQNGVNTKGVELTDCYVTISRILTNHNSRTGYAIFPGEGEKRRIPALACLEAGEHKGRLVTIYDYRHNGGDIGFYGNISLQISVSDDHGATWSEPDYCRDANGNAVTSFPEELKVSNHDMAYYQSDPNLYWNFAFGDAAIVADRESGRLLLMAVGGPTSLWNSRYDKPNQVARWYSDDGGNTWSEAECITYDILDLFNGEPQFGKIDGQFIASGKITQSRYIKTGDYYRLYAVTATQNNGSIYTTRNYVLYSDDFGMTWSVLGGTDVCPVATGDGDECKTEELPDGSIVLAGRRRSGNRNFNIFRYTDLAKGQGVWLAPVVTDMGFGFINATDGEILILPATDNNSGEPCYLALQSFPYGGGRYYVSIAYKPLKTGADIASPENFTTWEGRYRVSDRASVYSTMVWQTNNKLGFFFEEYRPNLNGTYLDFTLEEITSGSYSYREEPDNGLARRMRDELVDLRAANYSVVRNGYVGEVIDASAFTAALEAYRANPTDENYLKLNKAEHMPETETIADGGVYQFISAHNGVYTAPANGVDFAQPVYLSANGQNLTATNSTDSRNHLFKVCRTESGKWSLYNEGAGVYAAASPATSSVFTVAAEPAEYNIISSLDGLTYMNSANPTSSGYPSIHLARGGTIVAWEPGAVASKWYMQLVEEPQGGIDEESIESVDTGAPERFFDLQGRIVARPERGLFISTRGRKIIK